MAWNRRHTVWIPRWWSYISWLDLDPTKREKDWCPLKTKSGCFWEPVLFSVYSSCCRHNIFHVPRSGLVAGMTPSWLFFNFFEQISWSLFIQEVRCFILSTTLKLFLSIISYSYEWTALIVWHQPFLFWKNKDGFSKEPKWKQNSRKRPK